MRLLSPVKWDICGTMLPIKQKKSDYYCDEIGK